MNAIIVCGMVVILLWSCLGQRLEARGLNGPIVVVILGVVSGLSLGRDLGEYLNTGIAEKIVEVVLAVLLFVDATEVRRGFFGGEPRLVARLLAIALPLSLLAAVGAAAVLIPNVSWAALLVIACIVVPTDFAASAGVLRDARMPARIRHLLNVESGYNDGIVSPLFVFALALSSGGDTEDGPLRALTVAVMASGVALLVGGIIGAGSGYLVRRAAREPQASLQSLRIAIVLVPLLVYVVAVALNGNGFVAAFVAGIAFRAARHRGKGGTEGAAHHEMAAADDVAVATSLGVWFVFGAVLALTFETGVDWRIVLFGLLALTVIRMVPVFLALLGSSTTWRERTAIGILGPRGTASIVFGLLAYNALSEDLGNATLYVTMIVVIGSMVLHGLIAPRLAVSLITHSDRPSEAPSPAGRS